ncbi:MAG: Ig-like domain-containing protein [Candidatus Poribacteria bacterium]|nr:Ig-like domain-containing protein [Candidatus Poribacteria bacterium]
MSKIKNSLSALCYKKKNTKLSFGFRWTTFLIFQLFVALLFIQPAAWAGLLSLSVDANGDTVFNGEEEKLEITFETGDDGAVGQTYAYKILANGQTIFTGPGPDSQLTKNQTVRVEWDGRVGSGDQRKKLADGEYTIKVELTQSNGLPVPAPERGELEVNATLDTTAPKITIGIGDNAFSPVLGTIPVYYSLSENATRAQLEFQRAPGDATIGRPIQVSSERGNHTYNWNGADSTANRFADGQYTLKLWVKDNGGNEATTAKTETITIDSTEPRITGIFLSDSISLIDGMFVNASIPTVSFTADDGEGTGIDLTGSDTEIQIKRVNGTDVNGTLTYGNRATFSLSNSIDALTENGSYEVSVSIADNVGNVTSRQAKFTFDNAAPTLKSVATNKGEFVSGSGLKGLTDFVEAALEDNIELNLDDSTIHLRGPDGNVILGQQTRPGNNKIRWRLFSPLSAKDGIQDGQYTVEIVGTDKAGNSTSPIQISFLFDNLAPELVSLKPVQDGEPFSILGNTVYHNLPLNQFIATFNDGEFGTGVVFSGDQEPTRIVFGTPNPDGSINAISGQSFPDRNNNELTYILDSPILKTDGSQDGNYILNVKATDSLGNTKTYTYQVIYDTQLPTLNTTVPAANQTVSNLSEVTIKLNETTSGIDFRRSTFRLIRGAEGNQVEIPVNISNNGTDTATLRLLQPIALDGSDDGTYTIEVTPTDLAGNIGAVVRRQFYLVSQTQPRVQLVTPETGTVSNLSNITVEIVNYIGSGINFDASTITVRNAQGLIVPQSKVEVDAASNQLTWSTEATIPRNGTADGEYTMTATFVDFSGNQFTQSFPFILDTQFPAIDTVKVGTDPQFQLSLDSATDVIESFSQITVAFDETDVDFENTAVSLTGPDGTEIALHRSNDGAGLLTLNFQNLAKLGTYILTVTPRDNIGNVSETPFIYRFHLDIAVPVVTSVLIGGQSGAVVYVNGSTGEIIATLADTTGIGIAVGEDESNIVVTSASGLPVPGVITTKGNNQLIWRPIALPTDGSADGSYTVAVTPVDKAGRTGDVAYRAFIFDTQEPRITAATRVTLHQPISYIGESLTGLQLTVEDVGPASLELDDQTIELKKKDGEVVQGQITHDGINQLFFTLSVPLPTDGSADGEYTLTVSLVDKAGNPYRVEHDIFYDSQVPHLSAVTLNTETPVNLTPYQLTDVSESINKLTLNFVEATRVDFENTVISLRGPNTTVIPLALENNGVDQVTASFVSLTQGGLYTLSVTPRDIAGNTAQGAVSYPFQLQFEVPGLSSVKANTIDTSVELLQHEIVEISAPIDSLTLDFTDATQIDSENTRVVLTGPDAQEISITQENNENLQLIVHFISLTQSGLYTLSVTPQDKSGNIAQSATQYRFRLDIVLPAVSSVLIDGKLGAPIYVNNVDVEIVATFTEPTGVGLALGNDGSTIVVSNAEGLPISGTTTSNGTNQLTWTPTALPIDGSADGKSTVAVTPVDKAGRTGDVAYRSFIYDTQEPRITAATPITLHQPISYIGSLTQFQLTVEDVGPASLELDDQTIELQNKDGEAVQGQITHDGVNQLFFTLSAPLPTDGSADGEYTLAVNLVDKAGNPHQAVHNIFYDSQVPRLSSVTLNTETPLDLTPYQVTDLSESINQLTLNFVEATQVDFENTVISLRGPDDAAIPLTLENNGVDQVTASFVSLTHGGLYTLFVTPQDKAGNAAQGAVSYPFRLEFEVPGLSSVKADTADTSVELTPYETTEISESISSFTLQFTDATRIDFENTRVTLTGPDEQQIPVTQENNENAQLVVRFVSLIQSGLYTLTVTPQDRAGNTAQSAVPYPFRLEFEVPGLSSVKANTVDTAVELTPYEVTKISESISSFTVEFTDATRTDFENSRVVLTGPNDQQIAVTQENTEDSQLIVRFVSLTQSGEYTLSITPQDIAGNTAQSAVPYPFRLEFEVPGLSSVKANTVDTAVELTPYEVTKISESISSFTVEFTDATRTDFENSRVVLTGPNDQQIAVTQENTEDSQLIVRFVSLTQSSDYTLSITPQDIAGNTAQGAVPYPFRLEFEVPGLLSVKANTADASVELIRHEIIEISESVSSLTLEFTDASVDFENTSVRLTGANGQEIPITLEDNDGSELMVRFVSLTQSGVYTLAVIPQDKAGNVAQSETQYQFRLDTALPTVSSVLVDGRPGSSVYVRNSVLRVVATITDPIGVGVSLGDGGSTIVVTNAEDFPVSGTTTSNGTNRLTWTSTPLPTDGTADGQFTVAITPMDKSGRVGKVVNRQFIYDTQAPRITVATPLELHAPVSYIGRGLDEFVLTIEDVGPAGLELASQVVALMDAERNPVSAALKYDELTSQLYLTLLKPFANDGSVDGTYSLNVLLIDRAGNRLNSQFSLVYDSKAPQVSSVEVNTAGTPMKLAANEIVELSESISTITIKFAEATLVDFENTQVLLLDPDGQTIPITQEDDGVSQLTLSFAELTQIGQYTLSVTPQDKAGNAAQSPIQFSFNLEFILPGVESVRIGDTVTLGSADIAYVNANNLFIAATLLDRSGAGLSFDSTGSDILVALGNEIVPGTISTNGTDLIVWESATLSADGSSDGRYAVYVTPVDKKGREGNTIYREFIYDTQEPEITAAEPINLSQPVSYISESLTQFQFTLQDVGPADLTLEDQKISLRNQNGTIIPTKLTNDSNNQLFLTLDEPLPLDGSRDGEYTVVIAFSDKAGNVLSVEHPIIYDTQAPTLVSTVPADNARLTEDITQIQVNLNDKGGSGIDWDVTTVTLVDPNGIEISGELTSNGKTQLILNTNQLVADGRYTIRVQAVDRAGNGSKSVFETDFLLSRLLPAVVSTSPNTAPEDEAYTNEKIEEIEVMLETADENHLSTLRLLNSENQEIAGQQHLQANKLIYRLVRPLATDGSEDGVYTIQFTPISASGREGEVQNLTFTYDTQIPEVEPDAVNLIVAEPEVNNSLTEIRVILTDNQAGIDWENLDEEWLAFERISPNAAEIDGRLSYESGEQDTLIFRLTVPLADDGSADGDYRVTVTPLDKAGNGEETYKEEFTYDTSPPVIDPNSLLINDAPLLTDINAEDYPSAVSTTGGVVIQANVSDAGLGVNLSRSQIVVRNPNGQEISGTTRQNGVDAISFKSDGLNVEGPYQVTITGIGNDSELLGFVPKGSITTEFLYETTAPTAVVTNDGGKSEFTDEAVPFEGTAADPRGSRPRPQGEGEIPIPASGVWLVEIIGTGPDGQPIEPVPAEDESNAQEEPWSRWSADFLPARSGEYDLDLRVTDKAGNYAVYDVGEVTMSVSFSFKGNTFGWPNPLRHSKDDVAFFSFDLNAAAEERVDLTLYIYDWGGDMVYSKKYSNITPGERNDTQVKWNLENQSGTAVARGLYVFRLEAVNGAGNSANAVGKILVVD